MNKNLDGALIFVITTKFYENEYQEYPWG